MSLFVATNILLRSVQPSHAMHNAAVRAVSRFIGSGEILIVTPQIMAEFWNVATRPTVNNGFGFSYEKAREELLRLERFFFVLGESTEVYVEWRRLVGNYGVTGVKTHDARLVAAMNVYGIRQILTFNTDDFIRYREIGIINPQTL